MASKPYNGHPSYEHWNASLWVNNDEGLYNLCRDAHSAEDAAATLLEVYPVTGDGVELTTTLAEYAAKTAREDN